MMESAQTKFELCNCIRGLQGSLNGGGRETAERKKSSKREKEWIVSVKGDKGIR